MIPFALFGPIGGVELLIILLIVVLLFGAKRIPELARGLGEGIRSFKDGVRGDDDSRKGPPAPRDSSNS
jgi:sec-independent protein translocase protein TatA